MTGQELHVLAIRVIHEEFSAAGNPVKQVVLFGSRARHDAKPDSDWDYLVCIQKEISFPEKMKLVTRIQRRMAEHFVSVDIVIKSEAQLNLERGNVGAITYYALKDGVTV